MAWTIPTTRTTGEKITDTIWNTDLVDNISFLFGWPYYAYIADVKPNNTAGGTFTQGAWRTRDLNTEIADRWGIVSIAANQFTLQAGTYIIMAFLPASNGVQAHLGQLYNTTTAATLLLSTSGRANAGGDHDYAHICGEFTLAAASVLELQHRCQTTIATNGFGFVTNFGSTEMYSFANIWKVA